MKAKSSYNITEEEYKNLKKGCQICVSKENLIIDHSREMGRVRGMLCQNYNKGLGFFKDNPVILERASDYVIGKYEKNRA